MKLLHVLGLLLGFLITAFYCHAVPVRVSLCTSVKLDSIVSDSVEMSEVIVSVHREPIRMVGDTLIFDVASFYVSEGGRLKDLLKALPGIEVMNDGRIVANGKDVVRILLNGKDFFKDNKQVVLENIPADILSEVKLYRKQTEQEERTGVSVGEGEQVIDVQTLPDKDNGWFGDVVGAGGSKKRFVGNLSLSQFNDQWQNMISTAADNLPSLFGLGDSYTDKLYRAPNISDADKRSVNLIVTRMKNDWDVSGTFYYHRGTVNSGQQTSSMSLLQQPPFVTDSKSEGQNEGNSLTSTFDLRKKGERVSFFLSPAITYNKSSSAYRYFSMSYNQFENAGTADREMINRNELSDQLWSRSLDMSVSGGINWAFAKPGRNIDATFNISYGDQDEYSSTQSTVFYHHLENDEHTFRFFDNPVQNSSFRFQLLYTEPLTECLKLQLEYNIHTEKDEVNQYVTDLDELLAQDEGLEDWTSSDSLSKYADSRYLTHTCRAVVQYADGPYRVTAGFLVAPQKLFLDYRKNKMWIDTVQHVTSLAPEIMFYYSRPNSWNFSFSYMGRNQQPNIFSMLPIMDDTNPLHRFMGNAGLKPTFTHNFTTAFFLFQTESQRQISFNLNASILQNDVTQKTLFQEQTGSFLVVPENVSGNWNLGGHFNFSTSFAGCSRWYLEWQEEFGYTARKAFCNETRGIHPADAFSKYKVDTYTQTHYLALQYKWRFLEVKPYSYMTTEMQHSDLDTDKRSVFYRFGYGALLRYHWDGGIDLAIDLYNNCRRGYMDASLNDDELVCDLEFSYAFLKDKSAEIRFQAFDLFGNVKTIHGVSDVTSRNEIHYNEGVNSYFLLGLTYRFGLFGKRK